MQNQNVLIAIPVRLASTRLPNKPLADINGKTMIHRVYEKAILSNLGDVIIACDGEEIAKEARKIGAKFVITNPNLPSGTDRIYNALLELKQNYDYVINLQGDLPDIDPEIIKTLINAITKEDCDVVTLASIIKDPKEINNPNVVKIAISENNLALYFSRAAIPYSKVDNQEYFHHIGIYAYKKSSLEKFVNLPQSKLEKRESLEQLRALENNMKIMVKVVDSHPFSVDTLEDLIAVRNKIL